jgi:hypothetical protein
MKPPRIHSFVSSFHRNIVDEVAEAMAKEPVVFMSTPQHPVVEARRKQFDEDAIGRQSGHDARFASANGRRKDETKLEDTGWSWQSVRDGVGLWHVGRFARCTTIDRMRGGR